MPEPGSNGVWLPGTQGPGRVSPQECVKTARDALSKAYGSTEPPWQFISEALDWQRRAVEQMLPPE